MDKTLREKTEELIDNDLTNIVVEFERELRTALEGKSLEAKVSILDRVRASVSDLVRNASIPTGLLDHERELLCDREPVVFKGASICKSTELILSKLKEAHPDFPELEGNSLNIINILIRDALVVPGKLQGNLITAENIARKLNMSEGSVRTALTRLNRALENIPEESIRVENSSRKGYRVIVSSKVLFRDSD